MIVDKKIETPTNNRNYKKFKSLGYIFEIGEIISVDLKHLSLSSRSLVDVCCDICGFEKNIKYCDYNKNIKKHNIYACSVKCSNIKYKKTNLEKFGYEYPLQSNIIKQNLSMYFSIKYNFMFLIDKDYTELEKIIYNNGEHTLV